MTRTDADVVSAARPAQQSRTESTSFPPIILPPVLWPLSCVCVLSFSSRRYITVRSCRRDHLLSVLSESRDILHSTATEYEYRPRSPPSQISFFRSFLPTF